MFLIKNSDRDEDTQGESGLATQAVVRPKKPNLYQVVLLNDDYTPMEFVVELIEEFFYKSRDVATRIMLKVHTEGKGVCGVYTQDVAETKVALVNLYRILSFSRIHSPLTDFSEYYNVLFFKSIQQTTARYWEPM